MTLKTCAMHYTTQRLQCTFSDDMKVHISDMCYHKFVIACNKLTLSQLQMHVFGPLPTFRKRSVAQFS